MNPLKNLFKNKYSVNTVWLFTEKLTSTLIRVLTLIFIARYLEPELFGLFSFSRGVGLIFISITYLGIETILIREFLKSNSNIPSLLWTSIILRMVTSVTLGLVLYITFLGTSFLDIQSEKYILIIFFGSFFLSFNCIEYYFQSQVKAVYSSIAQITALLISTLFRLYIINYDLGIFFLIISFLIEPALYALNLSILMCLKYNRIYSSISFSRPEANKLLNDSWPLLFSSILIILYMRIDQIMIEYFLGFSSVGYYSAALSLSEGWYLFGTVVVTSLYPALINAKKKSDALYNYRFKKLYSLLIWSGIFLSIIIYYFAKDLISLIYGEIYISAANVLTIHIFTSIFVFVGVAFHRHLSIINQTKIALYRGLTSLIINIFLNFILIPKYGINGAAASTLISQMFSGYFLDLFHKETVDHFKLKTYATNPIHIFK